MGCKRGEPRKTHGKSQTTIYGIWKAMKRRCYNPNCPEYKDYGGRGIVVCDEWKDSFGKFYEDMGDKPRGMSLDRVDNNGNYEPSNCKWSTVHQQQNNIRNNRFATIDGESKTLSEWSRKSGINGGTLWKRLKDGWDEKRLLQPVRKRKAITQ